MNAGLLLCVWLALLALPIQAADYGFNITRAAVKPGEAGDGYALDADIDYRFSEPAIDALRNGVSLALRLCLRVEQERPWWWDAKVLNACHPFRVRYHALSKLYQILDVGYGVPRNFMSLNALVEAMGTLRDFPLQDLVLVKGERYRASLTVSLDIEALPLPLRPVAYATPAWHLDSPVYAWTFAD